jgi:glycerol transport system ATP-binding protein
MRLPTHTSSSRNTSVRGYDNSMQLRLESIGQNVGAATHLYPIDLALEPGSINVLLGATQAGKTSLMRIMAGLDRPSSGRVLVDDRDVTGVSVRERDIAMVYQQFINYPSLSVFENIASPLRLKRRSGNEIKQRVGAIAETLRLTPFLDRLPAQLSGGQQQRTALARALAKDAELLLLDEPLVNLDYKLREELRAELTQLFRDGRTTVVYATTEPREALQLGGHTAVLHEGRLLQFGATLDAFLQPVSLSAAQAFSDPPMNLLPASAVRRNAATQVGVRAHHVRLKRTQTRDLEIKGQIELAEISGSETYLHIQHAHGSLIAQLPGVHDPQIGAHCSAFIDPTTLFGFDANGKVTFLPEAA